MRANNEIVDNGIHYATATGVILTFVGIVFALYNFDTQNIETSIDSFISGMKLAFVTSIMGMISGAIIRHMQSDIETDSNDKLTKNIEVTAANSYQMKAISSNIEAMMVLASNSNILFNEIKRSLNELKTEIQSQTRVTIENKSYLEKISNNNSADTEKQLLSAINSLQESIKYSNSGQLGQEIKGLSVALGEYVNASKESSNALKEIPQKIEGQTVSINELANKLNDSNNAISDRIRESSESQNKLLKQMNSTISDMKGFSEETYNNSSAMLNNTMSFHKNLLGKNDEQIRTLQSNTNEISNMKLAFDSFLKDMKEGYTKNFIDALTKAIEDMNRELTVQFGENFAKLNNAVTDLLEWQKNYEQTIEDTTDELKYINSVFSTFVDSVQPQIKDMINSIDSFSQTTSKNVDIQIRLLQSSNDLKDAITNIMLLYESFNRFSDTLSKEVNTKIDAISDNMNNMVRNNQEAVRKELNDFTASMQELNKVSTNTFTDISDKARKFNEQTEQILKNISRTLGDFDTDFKNQLEESMENLSNKLEEANDKSIRNIESSIRTLAGTLNTVEKVMYENYSALFNRIKEL